MPSGRHARVPEHVRRAATPHVSVYDYRCTAGPHDTPVPEVRSVHAISYIREGEFSYRCRGRRDRVAAGALLLNDAGDECVCSHEYGTGDAGTIFCFTADALDEVASVTGVRGAGDGFFQRPVLPPVPRVSALGAALDAALRAPRPPAALEELAYGIAAAVLWEQRAVLDGESRPRGRRPPRRARERIRATVRFLDENAALEIGLSDVARRAEMSPYHFLRVFRAETGVTPHQYLIRTRLCRAIDLLRDTELPVTTIAYAVGFGDLANFTRTFRRHVGCSPRALRRLIALIRDGDGPTST